MPAYTFFCVCNSAMTVRAREIKGIKKKKKKKKKNTLYMVVATTQR
jgi:hypothetical protein